jgi:hypothetical protein
MKLGEIKRHNLISLDKSIRNKARYEECYSTGRLKYRYKINLHKETHCPSHKEKNTDKKTMEKFVQ